MNNKYIEYVQQKSGDAADNNEDEVYILLLWTMMPVRIQTGRKTKTKNKYSNNTNIYKSNTNKRII